MRMYDVIQDKRDGKALSKEQIEFFINGYVNKVIPDYQAAALVMAAFIRGMDSRETTDLTIAMANSGDTADLGALGTVADKHSTGGVADTTTLIVAPLVAACGLKVGKMSGRGLGHTGGTLDKLESIPGMNISLTMDTFVSQIKEIGAAVMGQTMRLCPADKMLYALRDVTATVDSMPLIASSIMSKKLASGADVIMLDVKTGNGAFMESLDNARALAQAMVDIGKGAGRKTAALISDMSQPLGLAVGNSLEVIEAVEILQGLYDGDLLIVAMKLSAYMLMLSGLAGSEDEANAMLTDALKSGRALAKLGQIIEAQGGNKRITGDLSLMPQAKYIETITATKSGVLAAVDCRGLGTAAGALGAGRQTKEDMIDLSVGFVVKKRIGDSVEAGDVLFEVHANDADKLAQAKQTLPECLTFSQSIHKPTLICDIVV